MVIILLVVCLAFKKLLTQWIIILKKLYYCGIIGKANEWFNSYLSNTSQFVSLMGLRQKLKLLILMSLKVLSQDHCFFLYTYMIYTMQLHCIALHYFAEDTNLFTKDVSLKKLNSFIKSRSKISL